MDWKRVKTILIIALVFVNALLSYTLYNEKKTENTNLVDRAVIIDLLNQHNIAVDESTLDIEMDISNVSLRLQSFDINFLNDIISEYTDYKDEMIYSPAIYILQDKQLVFTTETEDERLPINELEDQRAIEKGKDLIAHLGFSVDDVYVKEVGHTGKKTIITFGQMIEGHSLDDSYMVIKYNNEHLLELSRVWYDVLETSEIKEDFYSPEYALYKLVGGIYDKQPNRERSINIKSIELAYRLNANDINTLDDLALEGEAFIKWKITTEDNKSYLINALID